ncbi:hypothetical protein FRC17_002666 [Serendipita sp. 399]|nr:hypothetical protein FRC17_002666 [Serendipita sp. 399]
MTPSTALALAKKYLWKEGDRPSELPLAFQIRIQVAKGVLLVEHDKLNNKTFNEPFGVTLRSSMIKANQGRQDLRPGPVDGLHILDAACCILNVVKPAPVSSADGSRLSAQFITILSDCGVPNELFLGLQKKSLRKELEAWTNITFIGTRKKCTLDQNTRTNLASMITRSQNFALSLKQRELGGAARGLGYKKYNEKENWEDSDEEGTEDEEESLDTMKVFESFTTTTTTGTMDINYAAPAFSHNPISGWPMTKARALHDAFLAGIEVHKSAYWVQIWHEVAKSAMQRIVAKFHFAVERSASGFFQPDPTGLLNEGEVFFRPKGVMTDSETGLRIQSVAGEVIIGRHPALLPTDMRRVSAVNIPLLEDFQGIIFCSVKGEIPLAALCAGGDYDGDEATIIWEPSIVQTFTNAPLHFREPPANFNNNFDKVTTEVSVVHRELGHLPEPEYSRRIAEHLLGSVGDADSFSIYNAFWNMAVCKHGLRGTNDGKNPGTDMAHKYVRLNLSASIILTVPRFNALMDGKKAGIRIKDEVLKADKKVWTQYDDPVWRQRQKNKDSSESAPSRDGKRPVPYLNGEIPVLDRLVFDGDRQLDLAMADMTNRLEKTQSKDGRSGMDEDLAALWITMKQLAGSDMELRREVDAIEQVVRMNYNRLLKINSDTRRNANGLRFYSPNIRQLCRDYRMHPSVEEVPSFIARCEPATGHEFLEKVKASCAYVVEMENGKEKGFPWIVAMRELCAIKAKAVKEWEDSSERDTVTLPRAIYDRLEVHRYWRSA